MQDDYETLDRSYLGGSVSPPPLKRKRRLSSHQIASPNSSSYPSPAAIEAGNTQLNDHLTYFLALFSRVSRNPSDPALPHPNLPLLSFRNLYNRNASSPSGRHFVIHQHDHPRAGLHYDLRLQINSTSSCSWSVPYGLPGNPWEERRGGRRLAVETTVHCLWNHLIESGSLATGSLLIWETGEYEILGFEGRDGTEKHTDDEEEEGETDYVATSMKPWSGTVEAESKKLDRAFRAGKIRLRLHGTRLPPGYTVTLRLSTSRSSAARRVSRSRRQRDPSVIQERSVGANSSITERPNAETEFEREEEKEEEVQKLNDNNKDADTKPNNAYAGAVNTIGSTSQRWWFLVLDKAGCGFNRGSSRDGKVQWTPRDEATKRRYPFFVRGREVETSVVTGRRAADVLADEGVVGFVPRGGWTPALN